MVTPATAPMECERRTDTLGDAIAVGDEAQTSSLGRAEMRELVVDVFGAVS